MVTNSLRRYLNLLTFIQNWPAYFSEKRRAHFEPLEFHTRGTPLSFDVTTKGLYLVFKEIFLTDFYDVRTLQRLLPADPVVIDVGANAGYFAMMLFSRLPRARLFAFEPIEENYRLCAANVGRNRMLEGRAMVERAAVTGTPTEAVELFADETGASVTASVFANFDPHNAKRVHVKALALSEILRAHQLARVDLLKLDCEGSEYPIVYDSPRDLWPAIGAIALEVHDLDDERRNVRALTSYLSELGYRSTVKAANNGCWALLARR